MLGILNLDVLHETHLLFPVLLHLLAFLRVLNWLARYCVFHFCILITLNLQKHLQVCSMGRDHVGAEGISPYLQKLVSSYLTKRKLQIGAIEISITSRVPQASIPGPIL